VSWEPLYEVTRVYDDPPGIRPPGAHYTLTARNGRHDPNFEFGMFHEITFYRTKRGREVATDYYGRHIADDGDLFRAAKAAVEEYDDRSKK
jgi:hypothetical protein